MDHLVTKALFDQIVMPVLVVIASAVLVVVKSYVKKVTDSMIAKNELATLNNIASIKNHLLAEIATIVQAAVSSNMSVADTLKASNGGGLSDEQIAMLQTSARELIYQALPDNLTDENGSLMKIVGGKDKLDAIINGLLEHAVIEAKSKMCKV